MTPKPTGKWHFDRHMYNGWAKGQEDGGACYSTPVETSRSSQEWLATARRAMEIEAQAIQAAAFRLDGNLLHAVELIRRHAGKLLVCGVGKSGHVGKKIAATLQSTGTPAVFLHPAEAMHGDLGVCQDGDPVVMLSKSGTTSEMLELVASFRAMRSPLIGILGNIHSPLAAEMDVVLDASVQREADPGGFTPTASVAVALAIGHALAVALMESRGFSAEHFSRFHAGGQLGRSLRVRVADVMHQGGDVAWVGPGDSLKRVVVEMSRHPLGAACVVDAGHLLLGLITDGDVRRALEYHDDIRELDAAGIMTGSPVRIAPEAFIHDALRLMEDRPSQISVLPVAEGERCVGLLRIHDLYQRGT
jgi:arabinose-5-phosphate isomerase